MLMATSDQLVLGMGGTIAALVMMYSEFVLSQTGCGLPAGPFGLVGAVEGLSYLSVVGLGGYSLYQKITTVGANLKFLVNGLLVVFSNGNNNDSFIHSFIHSFILTKMYCICE